GANADIGLQVARIHIDGPPDHYAVKGELPSTFQPHRGREAVLGGRHAVQPHHGKRVAVVLTFLYQVLEKPGNLPGGDRAVAVEAFAKPRGTADLLWHRPGGKPRPAVLFAQMEEAAGRIRTGQTTVPGGGEVSGRHHLTAQFGRALA